MTPVERDLEAIERGALTREVFLARHGREGAAVLAMHERMRIATSPSAGDPAAAWDALRERLDAPAPVSQLRRTKPRRTTVLALAATLVLGGTAFAASHLDARDVDEGQPASAPGPIADSRGLPGGSSETPSATRPAGHLVPRPPAEDPDPGLGSGHDDFDADGGDEDDDGQGVAGDDIDDSPDEGDEDGDERSEGDEGQDDDRDGSSGSQDEDADETGQDSQGSGKEDS